MIKSLYYKARSASMSIPCHAKCDECVIRFKCYTTLDMTIKVNRIQLSLCREVR